MAWAAAWRRRLLAFLQKLISLRTSAMDTSWGVVTTTAPSTRAAFRNCARETFKVMPFLLFIWVRTAGQQGGGLGRGGGGGSPRRVAAACGPRFNLHACRL